MRKLKLVKFIVATSAVLTILALFTLSAFATPTVKVTYNYGEYVHNEYVDSGETFIPYVPSINSGNDIFYGWVDNKGNLFPKDKETSVSEDTTLYFVSGPSVSTEDELRNAVSQGNTYIKLSCDISLNSQLQLNSGVFVIDTNGYNLSLDTDGDGITGLDTGIVFTGSGCVTHNFADANPDFILNSLVNLSPTISFNTLFVSVSEETTVTTNVGFISVSTDISKRDGVFSASVYGTLSCDRFMRTNGISNASFDVYESAKITTTCEYLFEDISNTTSSRFVNLTVHGGDFTVDKLSGYASNYTKYQAAIHGGSYSKDIAFCFPQGNYSFQKNSETLKYDFKSCTHNGPIVSNMPSSCTEEAHITYRCEYCNTEYTKDFPNGIGHSMVTAIEKEVVATEEETSAGIYKHYCQKCDEMTSYETFYPNPTEVYVTVIYLNAKGEKTPLRVPAIELFSFDTTNPTMILSFGTEYIEHTLDMGITQAEIISVEIPLGTTDIYGGKSYETSVGVFCQNQHLEEVVLPESIVNIKNNAFLNMPKLKSIKGIEYISGTIGENAFAQTHTNVFIDQLIVNANTISNYAFKNITMNSLTFGANVSTIQGGAFYLDDAIAEPVKEIIVEGLVANNTPISATVAFTQYVTKTYANAQQQFSNLRIVYGEHQCTETVYPAECLKTGYTHYQCKFCDYERIDNEVPRLYHNYQDIHIDPTCLTQGYDVRACLNCGLEVPGTKVVNEKREPNAHDYSYSTGYLYATDDGDVSKTGSICTDFYCVVGKCACGAYDYSQVSYENLKKPDGTHTYDLENYVVLVEPTCKTGLARVTCLECKNTFDEDLPATDNHKPGAEIITKKATCTESGEKAFECTLCKVVFKTTEIKPLGKDAEDISVHTWGNAITVKSPTETEVGLSMTICQRCGREKSEAIPRLPAEAKLSAGIIVLIVIGGILVVGGTVITLYFTLFKKKRASDSYKYKFNTLGK